MKKSTAHIGFIALLAVLSLLLSACGKTAELTSVDKDSVSEWAVENVAWAVANGVLTEKDGNVRGTANAVRSEIAVAMHAFLENIAK